MPEQRTASPARGRAAAAAARTRRRERKMVPRGQAHIKSTFNNTIVTPDRSERRGHLLEQRRRHRPEGLA